MAEARGLRAEDLGQRIAGQRIQSRTAAATGIQAET